MNHWHSLPAEIFTLVENAPASVLLHSAAPNGNSRYSRLFTTPFKILAACQPNEIPVLFDGIEEAIGHGFYAAGYFAYEAGSAFEPAAAQQQSREGQPLAWFGLYERCLLFDHITGAFVGDEPAGLESVRTNDAGKEKLPAVVHFDLSEVEYAQRIAAVHEWIRSGDIYQLNFTMPLRFTAEESAAELYETLIRRQPVEYAAFLHCQSGKHILSFSPELFFRLEEDGSSRHMVTRPMKGTAARGRTTAEDRARAEWLRSDPKNRAENLMIVDLLRNDLGRLCRFGSVQVEDLFAVERHPTLWQMTTTVRGEVRTDVGLCGLFRALFPCGSITGAPKVRAMQLIARLEAEPRGVYTGAIGFFSKQETVFSVAIRTVEMEAGKGKMGVGSGIVIDSEAGDEYRECLLKAEFLTGRPSKRPCSAEDFQLVETLLWRGGYPRLELHLDRLQDSAEYFGFSCDLDEVRSTLLEYAVRLNAPQQPHKIRLLLGREGRCSLTSEALSEDSLGLQAAPVRLQIAMQRTDASDPMLFHKTTSRPIYAEALKVARQSGYDDLLFFNQRGELTESAIANVFVENDGRLLTPPIKCGLLAGVERRHLLATQSNMEERVLTVDDLHNANAIYLANAVRGLRRAVLVDAAKPKAVGRSAGA
jgi:para-aminobenzoate synthetase/4-amino-4-deoxychorismate lyase